RGRDCKNRRYKHEDFDERQVKEQPVQEAKEEQPVQED
ncbi:hypothetical protein L195_g043084, partial [Trifolium pratense]